MLPRNWSNKAKYTACIFLVLFIVAIFIGGIANLFEKQKASVIERSMKVLDTEYEADGVTLDGSSDVERPYHIFTTSIRQFDCAEVDFSNGSEYKANDCKKSDAEIYLDEMTFPKTSVTYISVNRR